MLALLSLFLVFFFSLLCSLNQSLSFTAQLTALLLCATFSSSSVTDASLLCVVKTKNVSIVTLLYNRLLLELSKLTCFCDNYVNCELLRVWTWDRVLFTLLRSLYLAPNSVVAPFPPQMTTQTPIHQEVLSMPSPKYQSNSSTFFHLNLTTFCTRSPSIAS